jgi:hypothetical protein
MTDKTQVAMLRRGFPRFTPPITQEAFEGDPSHVQRLVRLQPGDRAEAGDLWEYMQDLLYTDMFLAVSIRNMKILYLPHGHPTRAAVHHSRQTFTVGQIAGRECRI